MTTPRQTIEQSYRIENGIIKSPGKFEGEPIWAPYFWSGVLDGSVNDEFDDADGNHVSVCHVSDEDHAEFPEELKLVACVYLWESDQGFVGTKAFTSIPEKKPEGSFPLETYDGITTVDEDIVF